MSTRDEGGWRTTDPRGYDVVLRDEIVHRREALKKHQGADRLDPVDAMACVESPHMIVQSPSNDDRQTYYQWDDRPGVPPYRRSTVAFGDFGDHSGEVISYSRYSKLGKGEIVYARRVGR